MAEKTYLKTRWKEEREKCTACGLCVQRAEAITMTAAERTIEEMHLYRGRKCTSVYEINMLRCIFCGMCEEACPKSAIYLTDNLVDIGVSRESFVYGKKTALLEPIDDLI